MKEISLNVKGMHCRSCEMLISEALEEIGLTSVVSHEKGTVTVSYDDSADSVAIGKLMRQVIEDQGYEVG